MKKNFKKVASSDIKVGLKKRIYLANVRDIDMEKFPAAVAGKIATSPLGEDGKWVYVDCDTITPSCGAGEVVYNGKKSIAVLCDGMNADRLEWIYANVGEEFIAVYVDQISKKKIISGGPLGGLRMTYENLGIIDGKAGVALKFDAPECPEPFYYYEGETPVEEDAV
ncbi:MAG: hypothetical protein RR202_10505 [Bacteroidales bacterium]